MKAYSKLFAIFILSIGLLVGCNASKEEVISQSKQIAGSTFKEPGQKPTENSNGFSFYLPDGFKVKDKFENNVILSKGRQEYILFVNPQEPLDSEVLYNEIKTVKEEEGIETFKGDGRFGYISISPAKDKKYELIVGIGGVKMTTLTSTNDMVDNSKNMMLITNSVQYANEKAVDTEKEKEAETEGLEETDTKK